MSQSGRDRPNILITGTPGTGKTTTCELVAAATGLRHLNVGDLVKKESLHSGWDDEFDSYIIDEDKVRFTYLLGE
jgi:adenylate kinase